MTPYLFAFDFDHTVMEGNTDVDVAKALPHPIPPQVKSVYDGSNWTEYMAAVMKYMAEEGVSIPRVEDELRRMPLAPGMDQLLQKISKQMTADGSKFLIISDANTFFIKTILDNLSPAVTPSKIITNPGIRVTEASLPYLKVEPYENQSECSLCPKNLCKGTALLKYIEAEGPFDRVFYAGDGRNDLCPGMKLSEKDTLFVRKGYALEKIIQAGVVKNIPVIIAAKTIFYENGNEIEKSIH